MIDRINQVRDSLHKRLEYKDIDDKEILKISQELDELIKEYYVSEMKKEDRNEEH